MKGVIFDLDNTLTLTQKFHEKAFAAVFKKFGVDYQGAEDFYWAGIGSDKTFPGVLKKHGITDFDLAWCKAEKKRVYTELLQTEPMEPVPGTKEFLTELQKRKIPFVVASGNSLEFIEVILKKSGLNGFFADNILTNKDVKNGKPAPDIFLAAAEKIGVAPEDCVVFEDAWSGIQAAKAAGMKCVALETSAPRAVLLQSGADSTIPDYLNFNYETFA